MNAFKSLLLAAAVTGVVYTPLIAQAKQEASKTRAKQQVSKAGKDFQVEARITDIDEHTGQMTLETKKVPGHVGATLTLSYKSAHPSTLAMFHKGERVSADLVSTNEGPMVRWIASLPQSQQMGMASDQNVRDRGPSDTTCIDVCAGASDETRGSAQINVQRNPETAAEVRPGTGEPGSSDARQYHFTGKVLAVNEETHQIIVAAEDIPASESGATPVPYDLPYAVPDSIAISVFHEGDVVTGDMVVASSESVLQSVRPGKGTPESKSDTQDKTSDNNKKAPY